MLKFIYQAAKPFRLYILGVFIIGALWAIESALRPYLVKLILDTLSLGYNQEVLEHAVFFVYILLGWTVFVVLSYRLYDYCILKIGPSIKQEITLKLTQHVIGHDHSFFQDNFSGSLMNKINDVALGVRELIVIFADKLFSRILMLCVVIGTLYYVDFKFGLISSVWALSLLLVAFLCGKKGKHLSDVASEKGTILTGKVVDVFSNIMSVRLFSGKNKEIKNIQNWTQDRLIHEQKLEWFFLKIWAFQGISFLVVEALCLYVLIQGWKQGYTSVGDFALILGLNGAIIENMWTFSKDVADFVEHLGKATQGLRVITQSHKIQDILIPQDFKMPKGDIQFCDVVFGYKKLSPLFDGLNVKIGQGEKVGLVGYSGSGKSTFVNLILRLFDIESGTIMIDHHDIKNISQESLRQSISLIPQDPALFHRTVIENIWYARPDASLEEVISASKLAHAHEFIEQMENGYDTRVGERGTKLSGGQRQRIAIARAILKKAPILLLDEATSALDSLTEQSIQESLRGLMEMSTTLVIAHRLSTILDMDRIIVFDQGRIVQDGSHEDLFHQEGLYKKMWSAQIGGFLPDQLYKKG